jgi:DNA-binding transcriptional MerR regulator
MRAAEAVMASRTNIDGSEGYSGHRAADIVGITYRQLDYWARTDLVRPSMRDASGSGTRRQYTYRDLLELRTIKTLLDAGIKLESVRKVFGYLRDNLGGDVASASLVIQGNRSVLVQSDGELVDLLRQGQGVLNILPLGSVKSEVDARILEFRPAASQSASQSAGQSADPMAETSGTARSASPAGPVRQAAR